MAQPTVKIAHLTWPEPSTEEREAALAAMRRGEDVSRPRARPSGSYLVFPGQGEVYIDSDDVTLPDWLVRPVKLSDLRRLAPRLAPEPDGRGFAYCNYHIISIHPDDYWPAVRYSHDYEDVWRETECDLRLSASAVAAVAEAMTPADVDEVIVARIATMAARRRGASNVTIDCVHSTAVDAVWEISVVMPSRGRTVADLIDAARLAADAVSATSGEGLTLMKACALLRAGQVDLLSASQSPDG